MISKMFFAVQCFPTFITIDPSTAMDFKSVDPKVVFRREVLPTGRAQELIHVE